MTLENTTQTAEIEQEKQGNVNGNSVVWNGMIIQGGLHNTNHGEINYNSTKLLDTLTHYDTALSKGDIHEVNTEEHEEGHPHYLLDIVIRYRISKSDGKIQENLKHYQESRIKKQIASQREIQ